jgi:predicted Zn finger-like uncharacterized protein
MIVQCERCQAKYNLDDSKITPEGVRVRCSKCQHIFAVTAPAPPPPPPPHGEDDFLQDFESFEKFHKDLMETPGLETGSPADQGNMIERGEFDDIAKATPPPPPSEGPSMPEFPSEEWPDLSFEEQQPIESLGGEMETPTFDMKGLQEKEYFERPQQVPKRRKTSKAFVLIGVLVIIVLGGFYLWKERGLEFRLPGNIPSFIESIPEKIQSLWGNIRGIERGSLSFSDLEGYKDSVGNVSVFVIKGKVINETNKTKKHVRVKATLLDDKNKILEEKQILCGTTFKKDDLKKLPPRFVRGDFKIRPSPNQMRVAPRASIPFVVIFPNMPPDAQEFQVEIIEAPNA